MSLERVEITPFAVLVGEILQNRKTGQLTILRPPAHKVLYWSQGELVLITSASPEDSLPDFLVRRSALPADRAMQLMTDDPTDAVIHFHEAGLLDRSTRQTLLREWVASLFIPLFSLDEGTAAFSDDEALAPDKRVFLQSTAALVLEGVRAITNGLVLRRSLGDLKRDIAPARESRFSLDTLPFNDAERRIASALREPQSIEAFLRHYGNDSVTAAKVVIGMMTTGLYEVVDRMTPRTREASFDDMQRDLELLAAIGSSDHRSLRAVALSRQLPQLDHYQFLDIPRAATRQQAITAGDLLRRQYDPATYPPVVRDALTAINRRIDEAVNMLKDNGRRAAYDKLLNQRGGRGGSEATMQQRMMQRSIAQENYNKARELTVSGDHYGAIVLLKQAVEYEPDRAEAWYLLGSCQERNPKWRRDAAESFQRALSIDPEMVDAMISLGDLYKAEGLTSRAQACYEDALRIAPENQQARTRLGALKKK
ncbi:MAG TPA: tetratricopeptide repeat protein [Thermoanaerobaculia bacterium]|nr:tetratricopeptide repeat protein [Thermoanaerobaculia bacterium]